LKSEARNPKYETILNDQNSNVPNDRREAQLSYSVLVIGTLDIRICFEFRPALARHNQHLVALHSGAGSCSDDAILQARV
jgi:hypothetical protein